jgi:hypothetical protein
MQTTEKEAKRTSVVVALLFEFIALLATAHERALELEAMAPRQRL